MAFPLMALGAGLGQFAEQMQQQRAQQERSLMLQMQLANYQREIDKDRRDAQAAGLNFELPGQAGLGGGPGARMPQMPLGGGGAPPRPQASAPPSGLGAGPDYVDNAETRTNNFGGMRMPGVTPAGGPVANPAGWQRFNSPEEGISAISNQLDRYAAGKTTGQPLTTLRQIVSTWAPPNENPTEQLIARASQVTGFGPDQPLNVSDPAVKMKLIEATIRNEQGGKLPVAPDLISRVVGGGGPPAGAQFAQAGGSISGAGGGAPQMPEKPPDASAIAALLRAKNPGADARVINSAATRIDGQLQEKYKNDLTEYNTRLKLYHDYGPGRQQRRTEDLQDEALKAQLPRRSNPEIFQNSTTGEMIEWQPGTPLPQGPGWHKAGTTPSIGNKAARNVEVTDAEGKKIFSGLAHMDATGQWVDDKSGKPLNIPDDANFRATPVSEGRQGAQQMTRVTNAGNLLSAELKNMMQLPSTSTASIFQGVESVPGRSLGDAIKRSLAAKLTPEEATDMATTFQGVGRAVASLETGGAATGLVGLADQAKVYMPQSTDTVGNVMRKMATVRQILERSLESAAAAKDTTEDQKKLFLKIKAEVAESMPYTVEDVTKLTRGDTKTYQELFRKTAENKETAAPVGTPKAPPGVAAPAGPPPEAVADLKQDASPWRRQKFDEIFGQGAAARVLAAPAAEAPIPPPQ